MCLFSIIRTMLPCFFFKQKTAYEMRISDWSSDVCSSDLVPDDGGFLVPVHAPALDGQVRGKRCEDRELAGEGLCRGDADFRASVRRKQKVRLARHRAGRHVDDDGDGDRKSTRLNSSH